MPVNKLHIFAAVICLVFPLPGLARPIRELVPWSYAPDGAEMGMSAQSLKILLPGIQPLLGMFDEARSNPAEAPKDGLYTSRPGDDGYMEAMAYGISGGKLTQVYWSSRKMVAPENVKEIREKLRLMHGEPRMGHKAKVTKEGIARITTEVFTVKGGSLVISLSSALGETEVAVLDTADPKIDLKELYFSFEKQRERLRQELLNLTKKEPKDEADCLDVLREVIAAQRAETVQGQVGQPVPPPKESGMVNATTTINKESAPTAKGGGDSTWTLKLLASLVVALIVLAGVFVIRRLGSTRR